MRPRIGISLCLDAQGRWKPGREYQYLDTAYARAVTDAGGTPVYLPLHGDPDALVGGIDALLLPGGDDFDPPEPYPPRVAFDPAPPAQVDFDRALLAQALDRGLPVLGICYGMQLLALHFGGALLYDIETDVPDAKPHREGEHGLAVEPGSRLARVLDDLSEPVNSLHHQAVSDPGGALRVSARSTPDGLVEAVEAPGERFLLGVQWHPEKMRGPHRDRLFRAFVEAGGQRAGPTAP